MNKKDARFEQASRVILDYCGAHFIQRGDTADCMTVQETIEYYLRQMARGIDFDDREASPVGDLEALVLASYFVPLARGAAPLKAVALADEITRVMREEIDRKVVMEVLKVATYKFEAYLRRRTTRELAEQARARANPGAPPEHHYEYTFPPPEYLPDRLIVQDFRLLVSKCHDEEVRRESGGYVSNLESVVNARNTAAVGSDHRLVRRQPPQLARFNSSQTVSSSRLKSPVRDGARHAFYDRTGESEWYDIMLDTLTEEDRETFCKYTEHGIAPERLANTKSPSTKLLDMDFIQRVTHAYNKSKVAWLKPVMPKEPREYTPPSVHQPQKPRHVTAQAA